MSFDDELHPARYDIYCEKCKYHNLECDTDDPCDRCMDENEVYGSDVPCNYKEFRE